MKILRYFCLKPRDLNFGGLNTLASQTDDRQTTYHDNSRLRKCALSWNASPCLFVVIIIIIIIIIIVNLFCMLYCGRSSKQDFRSQRSSDLQYVSAGSAKYDVRAGDVITWKQQQYPYSHQSSQPHQQQMMRQQPDMFLAERDYATTLQMRRTAAQPTSPLLRPGPADSFDPVAACSCPLHGHLTAPAVDDDFPLPPPPSPCQTATSPRFSSFRPRVEHIYEVPKFVDGGSGDLDDDDAGAAVCNSSLYSELDTRAFGTVGRRTPSARGSRRQPYSSVQCS